MNKIPTNIKILLAVMFLFAGLIATSIFLSVGNTTGLGANISGVLKGGEKSERQGNLNGTENTIPCSDIDKDGLCDNEEPLYGTDVINPDTDGDGFLDGEEVASGHDPTKPGPNDLVPRDSNLQSINITDKISTLMAGAFYTGDLSADTDPNIYTKALADIGVEILADGTKILDPNNIPVAGTVFSSDSKAAQEKYLNDVGLIIQDIWGEIINEPRLATEKFINFHSDNAELINNSTNYFNLKTNYYKKAIAKLNALSVPPSWLDIHKQVISNLQNLAISHQTLGQTAEDPLRGVLGMNNLISVYQNVQPLLVTVIQKIKKNNLTPPNGELWSLISSLTDGF